MRWLPRSLFGRNLLLIVGLIVLSQIASAVLLRELIQKPRLRLTADSVVRNLEAVHQGLATLPAAQRAGFVDRFNERARAALPDAHSHAQTDHLRPLERVFVQEVSRQLAEHGDVAVWRREASGLLAVRMRVDGDDYWLNLPGLIPAHEFTGAWLLASLVIGLIAVGGAWWIQRRINRPLGRLVRAAQQLGGGEVPAPVPEEGPSEIATVSRSFNQMVQDLGRSERERAVMLAGLSHDLRTPLTKLRLSAEILSNPAEPELAAGMVRHIEAIDGLLDQFLEFSRLSASDQAWSEPLVSADLNALVRESVQSVAQEDVALDLQARGAVPLRVQALRRLVVNLVVNAQRHGRPPIEVATGGEGNDWWLEVRDRGPGISPAEAESLKQPFQRGDASRGQPGSGLGLAIVDRIARVHGARFDLLTREGGGLVARVAATVATQPPPA